MRFSQKSEGPAANETAFPENFSAPDNQSDPAQIEEFVRQVRELSKETNAIDISGCNPKPKFAKISGEKFSLQNKDEAAHTILFNEGQFNVPARGSVEVSSAIFRPGVYGFGCDDAGSNTAIGFIDLSK